MSQFAEVVTGLFTFLAVLLTTLVTLMSLWMAFKSRRRENDEDE